MVTKNDQKRVFKLLVINPNSSKDLTKGLDKMIADLGYSDTIKVITYTAPTGPESINNEDDAAKSAEAVFEDIRNSKLVPNYDGFVVACYSVHPLTTKLKSLIPNEYQTPVIGIFEASISTALSLLPPRESGDIKKFGIVTTGKYWEETLTRGIKDLLRFDEASSIRFKGVESTGLSAAELHTSLPEEVRSRMIDATKRLIKDRDVSIICLGCAGMAGMDAIVKEACIEELGAAEAQDIHIIDGVKAGIALVEGLLRSRMQ